MKILAIDPGTVQSAYVVWDGKKIINKNILPNHDILEKIREITGEGLNMVVIERMQSYGMAVGKSVFETCEWIGRFQQRAVTSWMGEKRVHLMYRKEVKMYWCNATSAKDSNIIRAIKDRYGEKGTKKNGWNSVYNDEEEKMRADIWQAFALAVTAYAHNID